MTLGSLFAGIGGMDLGLERAGMQVRWQVEANPWCRKILEKHWPHVKRYGDIRELTGRELERVDCIAGGFPCQPVSLAGERRIQFDERWLWPEFLRIARVVGPRIILLENVPGLLAGAGMSDVLGGLAESGFDAEWDCVSAAHFGAPHLRYRVFIIAYAGFAGLPPSERQTIFGEGRRPEGGAIAECDWWAVEPDVVRMVHGVRGRVDRIKGLGNAVVPQVAEWLGGQIMRSLK